MRRSFDPSIERGPELIDLGAKRPIDGSHVFLVGRPRWPSEPPFVLLHDATRQKESKRNIRTSAEQVVQALGARHFLSLSTAAWGTVWFRATSIREIVGMSPRHLELSSTETTGALVIFTHESAESKDGDVGHGFSLYGITVAQASEALLR